MIYALILQLHHTSNQLTKALVQLILSFGVRLCGKKKVVFSGHLVISSSFQNDLFLKQNFNNEIKMSNSLDRDHTRRFCLKSASLSDLINTVWRRHVILDRGRRVWTCSKLSASPIFMHFARTITPDQ